MWGVSATLGIDLASQPKNTALCAIEWDGRSATVLSVLRGRAADAVTPLHDKLLVSAIHGIWGGLPRPTKVAIDAPLGWPIDFVRGVSDPVKWPVGIDNERGRLERRATDHWVHRATGKLPLSVTTDRIGYAAMRAAGLLVHYSEISGETVDRTGEEGRVCEVYPDPAIRAFDLWPEGYPARQSYKGDASSLRAAILHNLEARAPWLALDVEQRAACTDSDDCLDALMCALIARAVEVGQTAGPPPELVQEAVAEGWIRLPTPGALDRLL